MSTVLPLVVVGGSAGSLKPLQEFLRGLPERPGAAFLIIQHMSPDHESHLDLLLSKHTALPVSMLREGMEPQVDQVLVCLPGHYPVLEQGHYRYLDKEADYHPIDGFCAGLAEKQAARTTLVVLSGTGQDGNEGAVHLQKAGGLVLTQEPATAAFTGMPQSLLDAGLADLALPVSRMPEVIALLPDPGAIARYLAAQQAEQSSDQAFEQILEQIRQHTRQDMSAYKPSTLQRRIRRRMGLQHMEEMNQYSNLLRHNTAELDLLSKDMLIGVTGFFRDPEAFHLFEEQVAPTLCQGREEGPPVRVWIAGCSTGEEAYSIAILLLHWFESRQLTPRLQIFATDVDDSALDLARSGTYPAEALANARPELVQRFFSADGEFYRINKAVRETIVFATHNLISDPPFSKLDLVVCRNLLIYLNPVHQKKLLSLFHFVLNPGGFLFLGSSENIGNIGRHFQAVSKQWRLFHHTDGAPRRPPVLPISGGLSGYWEGMQPPATPGALAGQERYYRKLIERFGPTQVLINAQHQLLFVAGDASPYLTIPGGQASHDLFKIARPELAVSLRSAINQSLQNNVRVAVTVHLPQHPDDTASAVRIEATPIGQGENPGSLLLSFAPSPTTKDTAAAPPPGGDNWVLQQMAQELNATREDLQRTIDQSRANNEEMRAANEEVMAMNEELQSANEELESSKEELQSLNEELATSNSNLDAKVVEVEALNSDLKNLMSSAESAILMLDQDLRIRHFTPACTRLMRVIPSDIGRSLHDVVRRFDDPELGADCERVLRGETPADRELTTETDHWYLRRLLPYRNGSGGISGVVLNFIDVSGLKRADALLKQKADQLQWQANLLTRAAPILGRDLTDTVIFWNQGAELLYGWTEQEAMGLQTHQLLQTRFPLPLERIKAILFERGSWKGRLLHVTKQGTGVTVDSQWTLYRDERGEAKAIVEVNNDISERIEAQEALNQQEAMFHTMVDWTYNWEYWLAPDNSLIYMTPSVERVTGYPVEDFRSNPKLIDHLINEQDQRLWDYFISQEMQNGSSMVREQKLRINHRNGSLRWIHVTCRNVVDAAGRSQGLRVSAHDITTQVEQDEQIRYLAYYDPLTGLPNRRLLQERLKQLMAVSARSHTYSALVFLDLDLFKIINDTQGHEAGDRLLRLVAEQLAAKVRAEDTVSRQGGDEFVLLLENLSLQKETAAARAKEITESIRKALNFNFSGPGKESGHLNSCSIGITLFRGMEQDQELLMKQADLAMYQAKTSGRNTVRFFDQEMQTTIDRRSDLLARLRGGLEHDRFRLFYQPQFSPSGRLVGAEALVRWQPEEGELVSPDEFIPLAEESGFILPLGQWVLEQGMRQLKAWEDDPRYEGIDLSLNVSPRQFMHQDFVEDVKQTLARVGCNPRRLTLELTESLFLKSIEEVSAKMTALGQLGLRFSLDDFGTGCSSLYYLKSLPLAQLKIDRSFVGDVPGDLNDAGIVLAVLALGRSLQMEVVAEGVETEAQREFLLAHGCQVMQGYLYGRPSPIEEWEKPAED